LSAEDPLYLFTIDSFEEIVSDDLCRSLSPLFTYLEAAYGPPFRYDDGIRIPEYQYDTVSLYNMPVIDGMINANNFEYEWDDRRGQDKPPRIEFLYRDLEMSGDMRSISFCSLTVRVPEEESHGFWRRGRYTWNRPDDEPHCKFTVTNYGTTPVEACWRATRSAIEMIECIRENVLPKHPPPRPPTPDCPALQLGAVLYCKFENSADKFDIESNLEQQEFWEEVYKDFSTRIDVERQRNSKLRYLLEYYQVHIPPCSNSSRF